MCLILVSEVTVEPDTKEPEASIGLKWHCCGGPVLAVDRDGG